MINEDTSELRREIADAKLHFVSPFWDEISAEAKDWLGKVLQPDPKLRFTANEAIQHAWLNGVKQN